MKAVGDRLSHLEQRQSQPKEDKTNVSTSPNPSPSEMVQLSDSVHQLSMSVQHESQQPSGTEMRPEYWVQVVAKGGNIKSMSVQNIRAEELMYGMLCVYDYMVASGKGSKSYLNT